MLQRPITLYYIVHGSGPYTRRGTRMGWARKCKEIESSRGVRPFNAANAYLFQPAFLIHGDKIIPREELLRQMWGHVEAEPKLRSRLKIGIRAATVGERMAGIRSLLVRLGRFGGRLGRSAMAGVAPHVLLAIRELGINFPSHRNHHASDFFLRVLIARKISLHVTLGAHHSEGRVETLHGLPEIVRLQEFQVLRIFKGVGPLLFLFLLGKEGHAENQQQRTDNSQ